jgi:predicted dehydrogenase
VVLLVRFRNIKRIRKALFLPEEKCYGTYQEMFQRKPFAKGERMDFVTIVTPNFAHFAPAMMALEHGFNVIIEKPLLSLEEAKNWKKKLGNRTNFMFDTYLFRLSNGETTKAMGKEGKLGKLKSNG